MTDQISPPAQYLDACREQGIEIQVASDCWTKALEVLNPKIGYEELRRRAIAIVQEEARELGYMERDVADFEQPDGDDVLTVQAVERALHAPQKPASLSAAYLHGAGITGAVHVVNRETREQGTSTWSEVRTDRVGNGQIAHCADQEDADLVAHLINEAVARVAVAPEAARLPLHRVTLVAEQIQVTAENSEAAEKYATEDAREFRRDWNIHSHTVEAAGGDADDSDEIEVEVVQTEVEDDTWTFQARFSMTVAATSEDDAVIAARARMKS